jgi:hypothetical protein
VAKTDKIGEALKQVAKAVEAVHAPREIIRDKAGKAIGVRTVQ